MSHSNKAQEFDDLLFETDADEPECMEAIFEYASNTAYCLIDSEMNRLLAENQFMSDDEFLDLIPVNGFFH